MNTATQLPSLKRIAIVLFLVLLTPLLTACEEGSDLFFDMAFEWAQGKELITCSSGDSEDCDLNWAALGGYWLGVGSDAGVQAMVDTGLVVRDINTTDALADEGFATGDIQKLQEASKIRPNDWSYDQQISVLHLSQGDIQESSAAQLDAEAKAQNHLDATLKEEGLGSGDPQAHAACVSTYFNLYKHREEALIALIDQEPNAENLGLLIGQLDLVRTHMTVLEAGAASPCAGYGPGGG